MSSAPSSVNTGRGGRSQACYALIAVRATVARLFGMLSDHLGLPGEVPVPAQSLGVVACAVRRELMALLHADALVLCAAIGALVVAACISWPQVSRIFLKARRFIYQWLSRSASLASRKARAFAQLALIGTTQQVDQVPGMPGIGGLRGHGCRIHGREFASPRQRSRQQHAGGVEDFSRLGAEPLRRGCRPWMPWCRERRSRRRRAAPRAGLPHREPIRADHRREQQPRFRPGRYRISNR
jgi:hypothetical protein